MALTRRCESWCSSCKLFISRHDNSIHNSDR